MNKDVLTSIFVIIWLVVFVSLSFYWLERMDDPDLLTKTATKHCKEHGYQDYIGASGSCTGGFCFFDIITCEDSKGKDKDIMLSPRYQRMLLDDRMRYCKSQIELVEYKKLDLIKDHNLTCEQIKFLIDSCQEETWNEVIDYGFFSNTYAEVSYGVCKGKTYKNEKKRFVNKDKDCEYHIEESSVSIYLKQDYIDYYMMNCIKEENKNE